jgi:hypothetical protein
MLLNAIPPRWFHFGTCRQPSRRADFNHLTRPSVLCPMLNQRWYAGHLGTAYAFPNVPD